MSKMIEIRAMQENDLDAVCRIEQETFSMPWSCQSFQNAMNRKENLYLVLLWNQEVVAYCGYWGVEEDADITNVAVAKAYRGQKLGYQLLSQLLFEGQKKGIHNFTLEVRESNQAALHLYTSLGFESVGIRKNYYEKPQEHAVIMWKR